MLKYLTTKPGVYIESTVVSYLVARPSDNPILAARQKTSRQLWEDYADRFEFVISPEIDILAQKLLDTGAIPQNSEPDAQHIAIATGHRVEYLVSPAELGIINIS